MANQAAQTIADADFRNLFEHAPALFLVIDTDFNVIAASDAYLEATMITADDAVGHSVFEIFTDNPADPDAPGAKVSLRRSLDLVVRHRVPDTMALLKYDMPRPDGVYETRFWSAVNAPVLDDHGRLKYIVHRAEDVTEFIQMGEDEFRASHSPAPEAGHGAEAATAVIERSRQLADSVLTLREASAAKDEFMSRTSHELRTPLTAILGFSELLETTKLDDNQRSWVRTIRRAGTHLNTLVAEVLDYSRIESGSLSFSLESIALAPMIDEVMRIMQPLADSGSVKLVPPEPTTAHVHADEQRLKQVLMNLISNGIKYNRDGGSVKVEVLPRAEQRVLVRVTDTGKGISSADVDKLFTPFERLGAETSSVEGTGLGLALSRGLVEAMGGKLGVESTKGVGSCFTLALKAREPVTAEKAAAPPGELLAARRYAGTRTVLYVEDTVANIRLVEAILARRPSVRILPAMLGQVGLDLAREYRPDLMLLDLHLPDIEGPVVLQRLRDDTATRDIPVVILTADVAAEHNDELKALGANEVLMKPIDVARLIEIADSYLDTAEKDADVPAD